MNTEIQTIPQSEINSMAKAIADSGLFGVKDEKHALALMLVAQAEGLHPATAARDYHIIQGRPALKAEALLSRFQASGGCVKWPVYEQDKVAGIFSHPKGGEVEISWTLKMAEDAGLFTTTNGIRLQKIHNGMEKGNWHKYPRQMLRARCVSEGVRTVYPSVTGGMYVTEEVEQFDEPKAPRKPISTEATVINEKPTLTEDHPKWKSVVKSLMKKTYTLEQMKGAYNMSPEIESLLINITETTTEGEIANEQV